jgi:hypothetical protein
VKKDIMKEKAAQAFRCYARLSLCNCNSALQVLCRIRGICSDRTALDMLAVFDTLRLLELDRDTLALRAVKEIYFATAKKRLRAGEITLRIRRLAYEENCDDRTVYRRLEKARDVWQFVRDREKKQTAGERSLLTKLIT